MCAVHLFVTRCQISTLSDLRAARGLEKQRRALGLCKVDVRVEMAARLTNGYSCDLLRGSFQSSGCQRAALSLASGHLSGC